MNQKDRVLAFLYGWATNKMIPHVKPGMLEELDAFITDILSEQETQRAVANMSAKKAVELDKDLQKSLEAAKNRPEGESNE